MNKRLYSHLYIHLKNILTLKKSATFANMLMEKPGNWLAVAKNVGKTPEEVNFKKSIYIIT